jgi:hypothetical protein
MRSSRFQTGGWLNASDDLESFITAIEQGDAMASDKNSARTWFAYHAANNLVFPRDPELTGTDIIDRLKKPIDPDRWDRNIQVFAAGWKREEYIPA